MTTPNSQNTWMVGSAGMNFKAWLEMITNMAKMEKTQLKSVGEFYDVAMNLALMTRDTVIASGMHEAEGQKDAAWGQIAGGITGIVTTAAVVKSQSSYSQKAQAALEKPSMDVQGAKARAQTEEIELNEGARLSATAAEPGAGAAPVRNAANLRGIAGTQDQSTSTREVVSKSPQETADDLAKQHSKMADSIMHYGQPVSQSLSSIVSSGIQLQQATETKDKADQDAIKVMLDATNEQTRNILQQIESAKQTAEQMARLASDTQSAIVAAQRA